MNLLISYGANINFKDNNDQTVLFYVCREGINAITKVENFVLRFWLKKD